MTPQGAAQEDQSRAGERLSSERGSVLLLGLGLVVLVMAFVAVLADVAVVRLARQELNSHADAAALAGAQAIDADALIDSGYLEAGPAFLVPINPTAAVSAVHSHLSALGRTDIRLEAVSATNNTVQVSLSVPVRPPFLGVITGVVGTNSPIRVSATAAAQTRVG